MLPAREDLGRYDPDVRLAGRERAGAVRAEHRDALRPDVGVDRAASRGRAGPRRCRSRCRCRRRPPRRSRRRRSAPGRRPSSCSRPSRHRVGDRVEDGDALDVLAALPGRDACHDLRPVTRGCAGRGTALAAGQALDDELRVAVDDDRHLAPLPRLEHDLHVDVAAVLDPVGEQLALPARPPRPAAGPGEPRVEGDARCQRARTSATCSPAASNRARHSSSE